MLLPLAAAWAGLWLWAVTARWLPCVAVLFLAIPIITLILLGMLESALLRRRAWVGMYIQPDSAPYRWLRGGVLMVAWQAVKAVALGLVLLAAALRWEDWTWAILGADVVFLWLAHAALRAWLAGFIRPGYETMIARHVLLFVNTLLFTAVLTGAEFYLPHPDYRNLTVAEAIYHETARVETACSVVGILARSSAASQALSLKLAQSWLTRTMPPALAGVGWLLFLAFSVTFLWGYSRLLLGALTVLEYRTPM